MTVNRSITSLFSSTGLSRFLFLGVVVIVPIMTVSVAVASGEPETSAGSGVIPQVIPLTTGTSVVPDATVPQPAVDTPLDDESKIEKSPAVSSQTAINPGGFTSSPGGLPTAPSGFSRIPAGLLGSGMQKSEILQGLTIASTLSGTYDSNLTQSPGGPRTPVLDDFILGLGGSLNYMSKAVGWTFGGNYQGSYDMYCNNPKYNGYNQSGGVSANYKGGRFSASITAGLDMGQGSNRNYATAVSPANFVKQISVPLGMTARYELSQLTSLTGNLSGRMTSASGGNYNGTSSFSAGTSALWKYSPLTEFGPGIRYTQESSGGQNGRSSIGPTMTVNYKLSSKVSLNSQVGEDFASYADGGKSAPTLSAMVGLSYQVSKLSSMNLSLFRDTIANPTQAGGYTDTTSLSVGYQRKIRRASWSLWATYDSSTSVSSGNQKVSSAIPKRNDVSFNTSLGMPIFSNTTMASVFMSYRTQGSGSAGSIDSIQTGLSISRTF